MTDDPQNDETLEALFRAARANPAAPRLDFVSRLMADADAQVTLKANRVPRAKIPLWQQITRNWVPASGLTAATVLGVWIGILLPETELADTWLTGDANAIDLTAFLPGADPSRFTDPGTDG